MFRPLRLLLAASIVLSFASNGLSSTGEELFEQFEKMWAHQVELSNTYQIDSFTLEHEDMQLELTSGVLAFFEPLVIDSMPHYYAAYFEGDGWFRFNPPLDIEKGQLQRFFASDSLNRPVKGVLLLFSHEIHDLLVSQGTPTEPLRGRQENRALGLRNRLTKKENYYYLYKALEAQLQESDRPFLIVDCDPAKSPRLHYWFDPFDSEEVGLQRRFWEPGVEYMEWISSYSQYSAAEYPDLSGRSKARIRIQSYRTNGEITRSGNFVGYANVAFTTRQPVQLLRLSLHPKLEVDSILDHNGEQVQFVRWKKKDYRSSPLYLFLNEELPQGQNVTFRFFYEGEIAERKMGEFFVSAGARWVPRYSTKFHTPFDMTFAVPKDFAFVATGQMMMCDTLEDMVYSRWKVDYPCRNASFSIGNMKRFEFGNEETGPIEIMYHADLHTNRNRQKAVSEDMVGAITLFQKLFGEYPHSQTCVSEILATYSSAYPGFIHLGAWAWETDTWNAERLVRAHEVAHQWWGVGVDYATYHDRWLSEGFAEYSSLMYWQAAFGQDKFLDKVKEYRKDIFNVRKFIFGSGAEAGPIILGYRTSSSKTEYDEGLIVYKKGALVLHMLRNLMLDLSTMREDLFLRMMQDWFRDYESKWPSTLDFQAHVSKYVGMEMDWFFQQWVYNTELPTYHFRYTVRPEEGGTFAADCQVVTEGVPEDFKMFVPIEIDFGESRKAYVRVMINQLDQTFDLPGLAFEPKSLKLNPFESVLARVKQ